MARYGKKRNHESLLEHLDSMAAFGVMVHSTCLIATASGFSYQVLRYGYMRQTKHTVNFHVPTLPDGDGDSRLSKGVNAPIVSYAITPILHAQ